MSHAADGEGQSLEDFFTAALGYSTQLRLAEEQLKIGAARRRQASGQFLPQISASLSNNENRRKLSNRVSEFPGERYSLVLSQVLLNWQASAARKRAVAEESQAEAAYFHQLASTLTEVANRYFTVLQAQDALTSISQELEAVLAQLELVESLYELQQAQITDLRQAQASLTRVQADQIRLESELAVAQESLRSVSGLNVGTLYTLRENVTIPKVENSVQYWVNTARQNNQEIAARRYAVQAAREGVAEQEGAYLPAVRLIAQRQDSDLGFDNALQPETETTFIGLDVTVPIYSGGVRKAQVEEARSRRNIAEIELQSTELLNGERVRSAYLLAKASASMTEAAEALVESTTIAAEAMQEGFNLGTVTTVDVLNAVRDRYQAERDLQRTRYEHIAQILQLRLEAGILEADDMMEVGSWLEPPQ
jgi:outer membrane protein